MLVSLPCGTPSTTVVWRAVRQVSGADWRGESADYSLLRGVVEHPASGINADAAKYRSGDAFAAALVDFGFLLLSATLTLMRMRNLILLMEKRRPWVSELILKEAVNDPCICFTE